MMLMIMMMMQMIQILSSKESDIYINAEIVQEMAARSLGKTFKGLAVVSSFST